MNARRPAMAAAAVALFATAFVAPSFAAEASTTIYMQRAANGRMVLTDRPEPLAVTERSWQMEREDPVAAQQRAVDVRRYADAVSARVQRTIDQQQQQRVDAADRERGISRLAQIERDAERARVDSLYRAPLLLAPYAGARRWWHDGRGLGRHDAWRPGDGRRPDRDARRPTDLPRQWRGPPLRPAPPPPRSEER